MAAVELGAGRETKDSPIDYGAGIVLLKNKGDAVAKGEPIALLYAQREDLCHRGRERFLSALQVGQEPPAMGPLILERIEEA